MNFALYVSSVESRLFLALSGLLVAFFIDTLHGALFRHHADPRPLMERLLDAATSGLIGKMNRSGRADTTLLLRGVVVLAIACAVSFMVIGIAYKEFHGIGKGGVFLTLLVAVSTGTIGWFSPLRALTIALGNPSAPRPYLVLARATYSNLVRLDDSGLIRVAVTAAIKSMLLRMAGPVIIFVLAGWQGLAVYWPVMVIALAAGQDGMSRAFGVIANGLAGLMLIIPSLVLFPVLLLALFFSAGASFFRALPAAFKVIKWPPLLQGGAPTLLVAYAMKLMLGGPRQDRAGMPVAAGWIGPVGGTAKLEPRDIGRVLYLQAVTLLIFASTIYLFTVLLQIV